MSMMACVAIARHECCLHPCIAVRPGLLQAACTLCAQCLDHVNVSDAVLAACSAPKSAKIPTLESLDEDIITRILQLYIDQYPL